VDECSWDKAGIGGLSVRIQILEATFDPGLPQKYKKRFPVRKKRLHDIYSPDANLNNKKYLFLATLETLSTVNCTDLTSPKSIRIEAFYSAIVLGTFGLIAFLTSARLIKNMPRRKIFFISAAASATSLVGVATFSCLMVNEWQNNFDFQIVKKTCFILG